MTLARGVRRFAVAAALVGMAGCAAGDRHDLAATDRTPEFNLAMHQRNIASDRRFIRPAARAYEAVTPTLFQHLIENAFGHLELPADFVNYLLQGRIDPALDTLGRFTLNTFMGAGGFLDPATEFGLPRQGTDFGITLGRLGMREGNYWVLPLLGPKTTRAAFGSVVDAALSPTSYLGIIAPGASPEAGIALRLTEKVHNRHRNFEAIDRLLHESPNSYVATRSAYLQRRRALVAGAEDVAEALPHIFEDEAIE